ncbi:MAG: 16S rRNA (cytidine(1402)-2'-O)-methyltransferase [Ignavibacteria bacterium]|nr:16S rRNA (cytidine(1402)-2'-O)-methyltransferase [Ignavibacteria bacterium]
MEVQESHRIMGKLFIVSTPIGNYFDITIRAVDTLKNSDLIVCEELKEYYKLAKFLNLEKDVIPLNEHNESEASEEVCQLLLQGKVISLISDSGTPAFADPGRKLINMCIEYGIKIEFIPGANSILSAIVMCGFDVSRFYFFGFLSPKANIRKKQLLELEKIERTTILMDTPYRLLQLLEDLKSIIPSRKIFVGLNITQESEKSYRGTAAEIIETILNDFQGEKVKGEFILIVDKS